jgi:diaminohydroxyphosphoribosylaminopyrimidine deaminase/5-amino-6-(5-phosphoribosylamino)uracil reductase
VKRPARDPGAQDLVWMQRALDQAVCGEGLTRPNPPVGAVVLDRHGRLAGQGFHARAGGPHAEIVALGAAGKAARGGTVYVTLEPCSTHGRTPPCTGALIAAGVKRVVYGCVDPNPAHAGRADELLQAAGIEVASGVLAPACATLIQPFAMRLLRGRPLVTLKLACTLDGRIADRTGTSKWITGPEAREAVQALRRSADAIMVGAETVRADDPSLWPRPAHGRSPWRVVVTGQRPPPKHARVFTDTHAARTLVYPGAGRGALRTMLRDLAGHGVMHAVCEGGGVLARALLKAGLVDRLWMFYAPKILGDGGTPAFAGPGWKLEQAPAFVLDHVERIGGDLLVVAHRGEQTEE